MVKTEIPYWIRRGMVRFLWFPGGAGGPGVTAATPSSIEEAVKYATDCKANLIAVGPPFLRMWGETKGVIADRLKEFVSKCHKHGIKVMIRLCFGTAYGPILLKEHPEALNWVQRTRKGSIYCMYYVPFRFNGCPCNPDWIDYLKKIAKSAIDNGVDAIYWDNASWRAWEGACYCHYCKEKFREYSKKKLGREYDIPPYPERGVEVKWNDPIWQTYIKFHYDIMTEALKEVNDYMKSLEPGVATSWNLNPPGEALHGNRFTQLEAFDYFLLESGYNFPGMEFISPIIEQESVRPRLVYNVANYKYALSAGRDKAFINFIYHPEPKTEPPSIIPPPNQVKLGIAEAAIHGGAISVPALPPKTTPVKEVSVWNGMIEEGGVGPDYYVFEFICKHPEELQRLLATHSLDEAYEAISREHGLRYAQAFSSYYNFLERHQEYYSGEAEPLIDATLLYSLPTQDWYRSDRREPLYGYAFLGFVQALLDSYIQFNIIDDESLSQDLSSCKTLVLPDVACMSGQQVEAIKKFAENGGGVVATGCTSLYDENYRKRPDFGLAELFGMKYEHKPQKESKREVGKGRVVFLAGELDKEYWKEAGREGLEKLVDAMRWASREPPVVEPISPCVKPLQTVHLHVFKQRKRVLAHLINYNRNEETDDPIAVKDLAFRIRVSEGVKHVFAISPDFKGVEELTYETSKIRNETYVQFAVPKLEIYSLVVIETKP